MGAIKTLYLLRHAKSSWNDPALDDFDRPLNDRGRNAGELMAAYLKNKSLIADLVICSPAKRAKETLECLGKTLGDKIPTHFEDGLYLASPRKMLDILKQTNDEVSSVMMIGHNPGMHMLALDLAASGDKETRQRISQKYPTAALAILTSSTTSWREFHACNLEKFVCPKDLPMV